MRIQHDLFLFLHTSPTLKSNWWSMLHIYEKICSFFKNLAESNHMGFKHYLSQFVPKTKDEEWNVNNKTAT